MLIFVTPHLTLLLCDMPRESSKWVVGVFLEAVPTLGQLAITLHLNNSVPYNCVPHIPY